MKCIQTTRWSGQHLDGCCSPRIRVQDRNARGGRYVMVGRGSWITPFTPILTSVGIYEMWEGAPARLSGRVTDSSGQPAIANTRLQSGCWKR